MIFSKKKEETVAIIGGGFTGLAAAQKLAKKGYKVTIFESSSQIGGLANSFKNPSWRWWLEKHYHHLFTSDRAIRNLAQEIGHKIYFVRPKTSAYYHGKISQIDSPLSLARFKHLKLINRLRTGIVLLYLKLTPYWRPLETITVQNFIITSMGKESWNVLWEPLMYKKFGKYSGLIPASWFWARIRSRTASLGYPDRGFQSLALTIVKNIKKNRGKIILDVQVKKIEKNNKFKVTLENNSKQQLFDKVICTLPTNFFVNIFPKLPKKYISNFKKLKGLGAANLVLALDRKFMQDDTYWLNINDFEFPFLAIVEHTNFMDPKLYKNDRIIYIANYLETTHPYFKLNMKEIFKIYLPYLKKINFNFQKKWIKKMWLFKAPFAQPIIFKNYSKYIPQITTPIDGLFLANIQQVYPWDRGTNYAVEVGQRVADMISK